MNWNDWIIYNELIVKLTVFLGVFFLMAAWEQLAPCRALTISKSLRWINNLGLVLLNGVVLRLLFPAGGVGIAVFVQQQGWGLLNYYQISLLASIVISVVAMDFIIYLQHIITFTGPSNQAFVVNYLIRLCGRI